MRRIGLVVLALGLTAVPCVHADTLNVAADAQTSSAQHAFRFGLLPGMAVRQGPSGPILKSYARFDLSTLPSDPAVEKTILRLWVLVAVTPGTIEVLPIMEPWQEGTINADTSPDLGAPVASRPSFRPASRSVSMSISAPQVSSCSRTCRTITSAS